MIEGISSFSAIELSSSFTNSEKHPSKNGQSEHKPVASNKDNDTTGLRLTPEQKKEVEELKKRDQEVRTHEQAHITVGGSLASPPNYTTVAGPDNKQYATGGEVQIDTSPIEGEPEKTIEKAIKIRNAATAPANPSSQDMQVAAQASQMEAQARAKKAEKQNIGDNEKDYNKNFLNEKISSLPYQKQNTVNMVQSNEPFLNIFDLSKQMKTANIDNIQIFNTHISKTHTQQSAAALYAQSNQIQKNNYSLSIVL